MTDISIVIPAGQPAQDPCPSSALMLKDQILSIAPCQHLRYLIRAQDETGTHPFGVAGHVRAAAVPEKSI